jgi:hypothetical protein
MATSSQFRAAIVIMALVAMSASGYVMRSLAAPAPDGATAPRADPPQQPDNKPDMPATSEELIATALKAGEITHEGSLRQRGFALYDDPR